MSLIETLPDDQYLAWWRKRRAEILRPVVKAFTRRELTAARFDEPHTVPTYAEWRAANTQTFLFKHTVPTFEQFHANLVRNGSSVLKRILLDVSQRHDVSIDEIMASGRQRHVCYARQEVAWLAHMHTNMSLTAIAARLGGKDHTTILHAIHAHARRNGLPTKRGASS